MNDTTLGYSRVTCRKRRSG